MFEAATTEAPVLYAIIGVIVLAVASFVGLVLFASREETFEDVVAKQRKAQEALLTSLQSGTGSGSGKSGKQNRKWTKLKNKKASKPKEPEDNEIDSGVDDDEPSCESVNVTVAPPAPEVVKETPPPPTTGKKKKSKKAKVQEEPILSSEGKKKTKPIAVVEEEVAPTIIAVVEEPAPIEEDPVEEEIIIVSIEENLSAPPESPAEEEIIDVEPDVEEIEEPTPVPVVEVIPKKEEIVVPQVEIPVHAAKTEIKETVIAVDIPKEKVRKEKPNKKNVITNPVDKVKHDIEKSNLNAEEIQGVIDILLEKQNEFEQWQKPNQKADPMEQLKRRIAEAEMQFAEERQSAQAIAGKNKELRLELQQERSQRISIQNEIASRMAQQESIHKRAEEKHMSDMQGAQSQIQRMQVLIDEGSNHHMEVQRLKEENGHLKNASMMAQQLAEDKQSLMTELNQVNQNNKQLRQELDNTVLQIREKYEQDIQTLQINKADVENGLSKRLQEVNEQLMKVEAHNRNLSQQVEVAAQQKVELETFQMSAPKANEIEELNSKLLEIENKLNSSESSVKILKEEIEVKTNELDESHANLLESQSRLAEAEAKFNEEEKIQNTQKDHQILDLQKQVTDLQTQSPVGESSPDTEKDQLILDLQKQVVDLQTPSPARESSPDLVVVSEGDILCESFEEVIADKDYQDETDNQTDQTSELKLKMETLEKELEERKLSEKSLQDSLDKLKCEQTLSHEELVQTQRLSAEKEATLTGKIKEKDEEIHLLKEHVAKVVETTTVTTVQVVGEGDTTESTETTVEVVEEPAGTTEECTANNELLEKITKLEEQVDGKKDLENRLIELKEKNNELREKNWKVIDALGKAESTKTDKVKEMEKTIFKSLKQMQPTFKIPKNEELNVVFEQFIAKMAEDRSEIESTLTASTEENKQLIEGMEEMKKSTELMGTKESSNDELLEKLKTMEEELKEKKGVESKLTELEGQNNELKEKTCVVIDALAKSETASTQKTKDIEETIFKSLKNIHPEFEIPEHTDLHVVFTSFAEKVAGGNATKVENERLTGELAELKKSTELVNAGGDEVLRSQEENARLKNVLTDTETMLSRLQAGVDAEVQKWQKEVDSKDTELDKTKKTHEELTQLLSKHGYEHTNLQTLENSLTVGQKQLMAEKEENARIKIELQELEGSLAKEKEENKKAKELEESMKAKELQEKDEQLINENELAELNTKLKKTISERDLLIREYKNIKDSSTKMEAEFKATKDELTSKAEQSATHTKEMEQLKSRIGTLESCSPKASEDTSKENNEMVAKLQLEIEDLKEQLREEQDCVIVDIDPDNAENLQNQVEVLSTKLHDIEKSTQEDSSEPDKVLNLESKLKAAEQRILELEGANTTVNHNNHDTTSQVTADWKAGTSV